MFRQDWSWKCSAWKAEILPIWTNVPWTNVVVTVVICCVCSQDPLFKVWSKSGYCYPHYYSGWVGGGWDFARLRLTQPSLVKLKLGLSLAKIVARTWIFQNFKNSKNGRKWLPWSLAYTIFWFLVSLNSLHAISYHINIIISGCNQFIRLGRKRTKTPQNKKRILKDWISSLQDFAIIQVDDVLIRVRSSADSFVAETKREFISDLLISLYHGWPSLCQWETYKVPEWHIQKPLSPGKQINPP